MGTTPQQLETLNNLEKLLSKLKTDNAESEVNIRENIKRANELRRAKGYVKQEEIAEEMGVERVPWADKVWYDAYPALILKRLPNDNYRLVRVYNMVGEIMEEEAILIVGLRQTANYWPRDHVYVEPSPYYIGKYQLVGEYNYKGVRIG